jgi:hypothetical protein
MITETRAFKSLKYDLEDGIIFGYYTEKTAIDMELAKKGVEMRKSLCAGLARPLLIDLRNVSSASPEAKKYLASNESVQEITAGVLLVESTVTKNLGNLFFSIFKPEIPKKIFTDKEEAIRWLQQFPPRKPLRTS